MRLDQYLVEKNLAPSRARASGLIADGFVTVNGAVATKPAKKVTDADKVILAGQDHAYVSRGGLKLAHALETFGLNAGKKICLDLGASTGGFCDVLLRAGAKKIYAVDVGHGQLHEKIAGDARVVNLEKTNSKELTKKILAEPIELLVGDLSFISLRKALPAALDLCAPGGQLAMLVKPQFEVGPENIGKGGLVKASFGDTRKVAEEIGDWLTGRGWSVIGITESPIKGGDGNTEYLLAAQKQA
jgi:23S rRNA (cytidine1920-2'-O)/16S rRNA (cytidine1409-2'-O)-methyltransferase